MIHFEIDLALPPECGECLILLLQEIVLSMAISWQLYTTLATIRTKDESASVAIISNICVVWLRKICISILLSCVNTCMCVYVLDEHISIPYTYINVRDSKCIDTSCRSFVKFSDLFINPLPHNVLLNLSCSSRWLMNCWYQRNDISFQILYFQVYINMYI